MAKVIDITEKLGMQGKPELVIGKTRVKVNNSAKAMLRALAAIGDVGGDVSPGKVAEVYELLFSASDRKKLDALELSFDDFVTVVDAAMDLVTGDGGEAAGNAETPATA